MRSAPILMLGSLIAAPASAAGTISITLPQLKVAEYHKPYVSVYLEPLGGGAIQTIAVWYDVKKLGANENGTKWLSDMRAWWRKGGRAQAMPADGVSGATRAPGTYSLALPAGIKPGAYVLTVEAVREAGGREVVSVPIAIPAKVAKGSGKTELGAVALSAR